ncbi:aldo/keto reductase [Flindersiella endophytica]
MSTNGSVYEMGAALSGGGQIPLLGFGTWQLRGDEAQQAVEWALEAGYRHLDSATGYRNQTEVGAALKASGLPRESVFVTTKLPPDHVDREQRTLEESLSELGLDHLDLWLIHWPPGGEAGVSTWQVFVEARNQGLTKAIGVSNYSLAQLDELADATGVMPEVNQIKWSPANYDAEIVQGHLDRGVVLEGYSPFRSANLEHPVFAGIAEKYGKTVPQVIVRWHLQHEFVVIPKSSQRDRIIANADAGDFSLTPDELSAIDGISAG